PLRYPSSRSNSTVTFFPSQWSSIARAYSSNEDPGGGVRAAFVMVRSACERAVMILASPIHSYKIVVSAQALSVRRAYKGRGSFEDGARPQRYEGRTGAVRAEEEGVVGRGAQRREQWSPHDSDPPGPDRPSDRPEDPRAFARPRRHRHGRSLGGRPTESDRVPGVVPGVLGRDWRTAVQRGTRPSARPGRHQSSESEFRGHAPSGEAVRRLARLGRPRA